MPDDIVAKLQMELDEHRLRSSKAAESPYEGGVDLGAPKDILDLDKSSEPFPQNIFSWTAKPEPVPSPTDSLPSVIALPENPDTYKWRGDLGLLDRLSYRNSKQIPRNWSMTSLDAAGIRKALSSTAQQPLMMHSPGHMVPVVEPAVEGGYGLHGMSQGYDKPESKGEKAISICSSTLSFYTPIDITNGLCQLVVNAADAIYKGLDRLGNSGLAIGFDILPRDIPLADECDIKRFTGTIFDLKKVDLRLGEAEMLWIEYEATKSMEAIEVKEVLTEMTKHIQPFSIAAFDRGKFGVGLVLNHVSEVDPNNNLSPSNNTDMNSSPGSFVSSWDVGSDRPALSSQGSTGSGQLSRVDETGHISDGQNFAPSQDTGNESLKKRSSSSLKRTAQDGGPIRNSRKRKLHSSESEDDGEDGDKDPKDPAPPNSFQRSARSRNDRFSGTVTLQMSDTLKQELTVSVGLRIRPIPGIDFADCKITLNPVHVMASSLYSEHDDDDLETAASHFYVTEKVRILLRACNGFCEAPNSVHPLPHHFQEHIIKSVTSSYGASLEISTSPKLILKGSKDNGKMVEQPGVTVGLEVGHIGSAAGKGFQWNYKPLGPYGTNLELSSSNPPSHHAAYRVYETDTPDYFKILIRATYRQNAKLARSNSPHRPALRILRDLRAIHVTTTLEVRIRNEGDDWFCFPGENKEGCHLHKTIKLEDGWLEAERPKTVEENGVMAQLKVS